MKERIVLTGICATIMLSGCGGSKTENTEPHSLNVTKNSQEVVVDSQDKTEETSTSSSSSVKESTKTSESEPKREEAPKEINQSTKLRLEQAYKDAKEITGTKEKNYGFDITSYTNTYFYSDNYLVSEFLLFADYGFEMDIDKLETTDIGKKSTYSWHVPFKATNGKEGGTFSGYYYENSNQLRLTDYTLTKDGEKDKTVSEMNDPQ